MRRGEKQNLLPLEVKKTGDIWKPSSEVVATLPVPLPVVIVKVEGPYTERDRKLWAFLIHAIWDDLDKQRVHEISVEKINNVFRALGGDNCKNWIWDSAKRLCKTSVEWTEIGDDSERYDGITSLLAGAITTTKAKATGRLVFEVPELLARIIRHPTQFARLRVHFLISLSGKYAVTLYEILEAYTNRQNPVLDVEISQLRRWLKVPDGKLRRWIDIKRFTLEPALKQINDNSIAAGFSVKMEEVKNGRAVARVRFIITKSAERLNSEDAFQSKEITRPPLKLLSPSHIPLPTSAYEQAKKVSP
jgi:plasmid replication initiation protein